MRVLMLAFAIVLAACGGATSTQAPSASAPPAPSASATPAPSATLTPAPSVTWPPAPSAATPGVAWVWSEASSTDTALVDRLCAVWTNHDVAAIGDVYAAGAQMVFRSMAQPGDLAMIRSGIQASPDTYERAGGVLMATVPDVIWPGRPEGSRFLFFKLRVTGNIVASWLEVNREGKIVMAWEDETK